MTIKDRCSTCRSNETVCEWIPCSERLPKEADKTVLISMPNGFINLGLYSEFSKTWYKGSICAVGGKDPIAWMPLPEPFIAG